ncbi:MAG: amidohydrolase family protein [Spirochaetes bacterium]|nr:amidohydrolase family protein [Spirochaetota bacterium]MBU1082173.1 amidohydrolase family protein [Spirochaetota bacterium]
MTIFKNGFIVDGTGARGYVGDILVDGDRILEASQRPISAPGAAVVECAGKTVAPGFIDLHSHNDWFLPDPAKEETYIEPFLRQGITTFVGGNCGFGIAGLKKGSEYRGLIEGGLFKAGVEGLAWDSFADYFGLLERRGLGVNLACLAGSGTLRASIKGHSAEPFTRDQAAEYDGLVRSALDDGAAGLSFGMGYAPDIFLAYDDLKRGASLAAERGGLVTIHARAFSRVSGAYPLKPFGEAHNLIALKECLALARDTGARLQVSHLIFVGKRSWPTLEPALALVDEARADGVDVAFDTYAHHSGATVITGILPDWFMASLPEGYDDPRILRKVRLLMAASFALLGFGFGDMRLAAGNHPEISPYDGLYLSQIAKARGLGGFENYIDIARKSGGSARLLIDKYSSPELVAALMRHPASHFMTDSWIEPAGLQNPAALGCFPRFLERAREGVIPLEEAVRKMSGANADRARLEGRGYVKAGYYADLVVFDAAAVADRSGEGKPPLGIESVWVNGTEAIRGSRRVPGARAGKVLRAAASMRS